MIILLNGSINAGKSTIGRAIQSKLTQVAHLEVDSIHHFIPWVPHSESVPVILENVVSIAKNFIRRGFRVVITWPLSEKCFTYLSSELAGLKVPIIPIALCPGLDLALSNRGTRELDAWETNRVREMHACDLAKPKFGFWINNSNLSVDETVSEVLKLAQWSVHS